MPDQQPLDPKLAKAGQKAERMGVGSARYQLLMCVDKKTSKCASPKQMTASWKYLKKRVKQISADTEIGIIRTRTYCVGVCRGGPLLVVMPDGVWYGQCTEDVIERILQEHILDGKIVSEYRIAQLGWS